MKASANHFPYLFLLMQTSHQAAADASCVRLYWKDGSLFGRQDDGTIIQIGPQAVGAQNFTELLDTPSSYSGEGLKRIRVKADESGLEFVTPDTDILPDQSGHSGHWLRTNGSAADWEEFDINEFLPDQSGQGGRVLKTDGEGGLSWQDDLFGGSSFLGLSDTPNSFTSQGLKLVRVNATEDALEFYTLPDSSTIADYSYDPVAGEGTHGLVPGTGPFVLPGSFLRYDGSWRPVQFTELGGAPNSYTGFASALVQVRADEGGLQFLASGASIEQIALVQVRKNSASFPGPIDYYTRRRINFIEGSNISLSISDDNTDKEVDVTISATASSTARTNMRVNSSSYEASRVIKNSSGHLKLVYGYNSGPAQFIQVHDASALPADGAAPASLIQVDSSKSFSISLDDGDGIPFSNGIIVCNSTTGPTKTIGGANCYFTGIYD